MAILLGHIGFRLDISWLGRMYKKNTAVTGFCIGCFLLTTDGSEVTTGSPTGVRMIDGGTPVNCDNIGSASYDTTLGAWKINLSADDMNGSVIAIVFKLAGCVPIWFNIHTVTGVPDSNGKYAATLQSTDVTGYLETNCIQIKSVDADTALVNNVGPDVFLDYADTVEDDITIRMALRAVCSAMAGLLSGAGTGSEVFKAIGASSDGTTRITVQGDATGNRTGVVLNL